jgi:tetratricopeptide (TPR) repeat protein
MVVTAPVSSAQGFRWPEEPENLKVLAPEVTGARLGQVMRGFSTSLGVRCEYCHVGEGPDLSTFDFASDEKLTKRKARIMIEMVNAINDNHLTKLTSLEKPSQPRTEVTCITCHRTQSKPLMLDDVLSETINAEGIEAALDEYRSLREEHYGGFAYDFSVGMLTGLGERLGAEENFDAALRILDLEIEMNGEAPAIYFALGGVQASAGMRDEAIGSFEKGLQIAPEGWKPFFQKEIDRLRDQ